MLQASALIRPGGAQWLRACSDLQHNCLSAGAVELTGACRRKGEMGRTPCCSKEGLLKGPWSTKEDMLLTNYIQAHGEGQWRSLPKRAGLLRCGKSCRLRWLNYLRPSIKRGNITSDEEDLIIRLQSLLGNRWSLIAGRLPGRTDNEIKNHWNTYLLKRLKKEGIEPKAHKHISKSARKPESKTNNGREKNQPAKPKKHNDRDDSDKENISMGKVYHPKPIRVSSGITASCNSVGSAASDSAGSVGSSSQQQQQEVHEAPKTKVSYTSWSSFDSGDETLLVDYDLLLQEADDTLFEKVYDEYLQLL